MFVTLAQVCQVKKSLIVKDSQEQHGNTSPWHRYSKVRRDALTEVTKS